MEGVGKNRFWQWLDGAVKTCSELSRADFALAAGRGVKESKRIWNDITLAFVRVKPAHRYILS